MRKVLVTSESMGSNIGRLSKFASVVESWKLDDEAVQNSLPEIDAALVFDWPTFLTRENLAKMSKLRFIQTVMVGVNHIPFRDLPKNVIVCNNAGAFSLEVGEHAWALLMSAAKKIVQTDAAVKAGGRTLASFGGEEAEIIVLRGRTMGIVGFGGIGKAVAMFAKAFGMKVVAFNRSRRRERGVTFLYGRKGLEQVLRQSDAVLISLPLTRATERLIGARELGLMKRQAVLVNVARGDIVEEAALYDYMAANPSFRYATDVWWSREGKETLEPDKPLLGLPNFTGTPHTSGPTGIAGGEPQRLAVENTIRFLRGLRPMNVVDRSEYLEP